ncbi:MAG: agmatinase family protein [Cyclobacteriaceae bacterium]|nr:agmatinase family protein [Cyclobacteriaceae bacterium]
MSSADWNNFDINGPGIQGNLFGLPCTPEQAALVLIPVPWEVTVSYREGTALGPGAILKASQQVDLFFREHPDLWKKGMAMLPIDPALLSQNQHFRSLAATHIEALESGQPVRAFIQEKVNTECSNLLIYVRNQALSLLQKRKLVGIVGGDHSSPLGLLQALTTVHEQFGILHFDAHMDLRKAYEGFTYSHGSIMYNALRMKAVTKLVQVGIRDYCQEENDRVTENNPRIKVFFDEDIRYSLDTVKSWEGICREIIRELPEKVYISFDIDALDPSLCPSTGSPVPGGLSFHQAVSLLRMLEEKGKQIIGFDLCEVAPDARNDYDANVGARLLFHLCHRTLATNL